MNSFLKFHVMGRTKIDLFGIAHVKVELIFCTMWSLYIDMDDFSLFLPSVQAYATLMIVRLRPTRFLSLLPASYGQKATITLFR